MGRLWILPGILLVPVLLMAADYTDYINGKWYKCDSWVVDAAGDTVYKKLVGGRFQSWVTYNDNHQKVYTKLKDGSECYMEYNEAGKPKSEVCSNGNNGTYTYDSRNRLIKYEYEGVPSSTVLYEYDGNSDRVIHTMFTGGFLGDGESWLEYDRNNNLLKEIHSNGMEKGYYPNGKERYFKTPDGTILWYDERGYQTAMEYDDGRKVVYDKNLYDKRGRILYEGRNKTWYSYYTKHDTTFMCEDAKRK